MEYHSQASSEWIGLLLLKINQQRAMVPKQLASTTFWITDPFLWVVSKYPSFLSVVKDMFQMDNIIWIKKNHNSENGAIFTIK